MSYLPSIQANITKDIKDPTGFVDNENITVNYSVVTRMVTLSHPSGFLTYYYRGVKKTLASPWTSVAHDEVLGIYRLSSSDGINFTWTTTPWKFYDIQICFAIYGEVDKYALREVHSLMDWYDHEETHDKIGTYRLSGLTLDPTTFVKNPANNAATNIGNRPKINEGYIKDEDVTTFIASTTAGGSYTTMYLDASNNPIFNVSSSDIYHQIGNVTQYNLIGTGLVNMSNNNHINLYCYHMPVCSGSICQQYRSVWVTGQVQYSTSAAALAESPLSLQLGNFAGLVPEIIPYARVTIQYTTAINATNVLGRCKIIDTIYLEGSRATLVSISGGVSYVTQAEKDAPGGIPTLNSNSQVVQMPEVQEIKYIVNTPVFSNVPTITEPLDPAFALWTTDYYYVTLEEMATILTESSAVFTTTTVAITEPTATFSIGNEISISNSSIIANNKTATITNVVNNGTTTTYTFAASTFTVGTSTTIITMGTMTALPSGQFKLMTNYNSPASAINQIFTLANLATGNSGTLVENTRVDFLTIGDAWSMRFRDTTTIEVPLTGNLQTKDIQINISGMISKTYYLYINLWGLGGTTIWFVSSVGNGYASSFLFPTNSGQTKKFIFNATTLKLHRYQKEILAEYQMLHSGSDRLGGTTTFTSAYVNGTAYRVDRSDINSAITTIKISGGGSFGVNDMLFSNGMEVTIKEIL